MVLPLTSRDLIKRSLTVEISAILTFLALWEAVARFKLLPAYALPSIEEVAAALYSQAVLGNLSYALPHSLLHLALGFAAAFAVAFPLGMAMGWYRVAQRFFEPLIGIFRPIPPIAWIPFALLFFVSLLQASAFIIFIGAFFPLVTNIFFGFRNVPKQLAEIAHSFGASEREILLKVAFPSALPSILTGVKVGLGVAWMCVVAAEMFGAPGLGFMIMQMRYVHDIAGVVAYMAVIGALGLLLEVLVKLLERKLLKWRIGLVAEGI
ncbi:MAG TPA: ABC transporter permease [Candidatus Methanomethylia archaeon]|nr:ABC transporter permease [Candidatus Methanomethylicia archaeon]